MLCGQLPDALAYLKIMDSDTPLSYADYQRLIHTDVEQWSENEFAHFLALDGLVLQNAIPWIEDMKIIQDMFLKEHAVLTGKYARWKFIADVLDKMFFNFYVKTKSPNKKSILIQNPSPMFDGITKHYHAGLIIRNKKYRLFAMMRGMGYMSLNDLDHYSVDYLQDKNVKHLYAMVKNIEDRLRIAKPEYVVLMNDCYPVGRAIVVACKKLGIRTIVIQHGAYDSYTPLYNCKAADYVLVWGEYFKNEVLAGRGIRRPEELFVLGYPGKLPESAPSIEKKPFKVCYLGQDYEKYNKNLLQIKLDTVKELLVVCKKLGLEFMYRPHPTDDRKMLQEKLPEVVFTTQGEHIQETFKKSDIVISFNSTALAEATIASKVSLQLLNYPVKADNFEVLGACAKSFENMGQLQEYLSQISKAENLDAFKKKFNNYYIETRYNPNERFLEILQEIEKQKS